eukprot:TRINITY_DN6498_c0_g1_i1.p1 TRINITY_DN6498_c0_g1~~TRINITY_DN6498_c0_g1_i1.p1  ORF type:complete len:288 (+),score=37.02 TRINITY_DN6498_c0_g1_i1:29-892(+)
MASVDSPVVKKKIGPRTILDGIDYYLKYLGAAPTTMVHGPGSTTEAVERIRQQAKGSKIMHKVKVTVSTKFIRVYDFQTDALLFSNPLYRISYCTVDQINNKICCYIVRESGCKDLNVHAFYCSKKSKAEALTLTVSEAFNVAFAEWQAKKIIGSNETNQQPQIKPKQTDETETNNLTDIPINESDTGITRIQEVPEIPEVTETAEAPQTKEDKAAEPDDPSNLRIESFDGEMPLHHPVSMAPLGHDDVFGEMNIEDFSEEVQCFLRGEVSAEDLVRARSVDDLLDL